MAAAVAGGGALMLAVALGVPGLLRSPADGSAAAPTVATAKRITVSRTPPVVPLSDTELREVVDRSPDYGALSDPARRASCLTGLGYPAGTPVLGARTVRVDDRPAVVLVLAGDSPGLLTALVVDPGCSAADTGLVADTTIARR